MASLLKTRPRAGWIRADIVPENLKDELLRLHSEIDSLNAELKIARVRSSPEGVDELAQGSELTTIMIEFDFAEYTTFSLSVRWDHLIRAILPQTFGGGAPPEAVASAIASLVQREAADIGLSKTDHGGWRSAVVSRSDYGKIMNQMVALGLVEGRSDPTNTGATKWYATPYGVQAGARLFAARRA
jgi:hypothetical protein